MARATDIRVGDRFTAKGVGTVVYVVVGLCEYGSGRITVHGKREDSKLGSILYFVPSRITIIGKA